MRDQRNAIAWAVGWWFVRRALRKRAHGAAKGGVFGKLLGGLALIAVVAGAIVAWRRFAGGGGGGGGAPLEPRPEPAPRAPAAV